MTYTFPESLSALRRYLKSRGFEGDSIKTARQAAFVAQQLLGTRVKFPPQGQDMTLVLMEIQKAVPARGVEAASTRGRSLKGNRPQAAGAQGVEGGRKPKGNRKGAGAPARNPITCDISVGLHIFCDGASVPNPGAGGWGVVAYRDGVEVSAQRGGNPDTTNNAMELTALLVAIERAGQFSGNSGELITIWSDSQYCVKGVNEWLAGWKRNGWNRKKPNSPNRAAGEIKNLELWQAIDEVLTDASKSGDISVKWVKGHAGVGGNERADELAEIGRQEALARGASGADLALAPPADASRLVPTPADDCRDLDERYRQIMGAA